MFCLTQRTQEPFNSEEKKRQKRDESSKSGDGSIERLAVAFHSQNSGVPVRDGSHS